MPLSFFENAYLLQSIGWAIANSFWQTAVLWGLYTLLIGNNNKISALLKYNFGLVFLFSSFIWYLLTIFSNYQYFALSSISKTTFNNYTAFQSHIYLPFIALTYFALLIFYVLKFIRNYLKIRFIRVYGLTKPPNYITLFVSNTALKMGIKKKISIWMSINIDVPSVVGFLKPMILLPAAMLNNLNTDQVNAILLHEITHIKRNDFVVNFIQSIIRLVLFFNPFLFLLDKIVKQERENCCDDQVLNFKYDTLLYAKALLILEEKREKRMNLTLAATNNKRLLSKRIKRLFIFKDLSASTSLMQKIVLTSAALFLLIAIFFTLPTIKTGDIKSLNIVNQSVLQNQQKASFKKNYIIPARKLDLVKLTNEAIIPAKITKKIREIPSKKVIKPLEQDYVVATINKDALLRNTKNKELAKVVLNENDGTDKTLLLKIEDQQSDKNKINTFYFRVKIENGKVNIEPLLILEKYKKSSIILKNKHPNKLHKNQINSPKSRITT